MRIYGDRISGNCHKVTWTADLLEHAWSWEDVNVLTGETRTPEFLAMNPAGQVPLVRLDDGRYLAQSNAIVTYLARGSLLLPTDPYLRARVDEWLFWEQYSHEPYIAVSRFQMRYLGRSAGDREGWRVERGEAALDLLERSLRERDWLVGEGFTVADIALLAYTRLAGEGGFDLRSRPALRDWVRRGEERLGPPRPAPG